MQLTWSAFKYALLIMFSTAVAIQLVFFCIQLGVFGQLSARTPPLCSKSTRTGAESEVVSKHSGYCYQHFFTVVVCLVVLATKTDTKCIRGRVVQLDID